MRVWSLLVVFALLLGCSTSPVDHAFDGEDSEEIVEPVTCSPALKRYPVNGPHNGGWDKNALTYACHPHPSHAPDNSDFIKGDHYGNDIFGAKGTPIVSPVDGTIVKSGWNNVGGWRVTVRDGCGWYYYLCHLDTITGGLPVGASVKAGQQIGTLGNTGNAQGTSPHLHFSIYPGVYEQGIDPFPLLQAVDVSACGQACKPRCEGSTIVGADCGKGNCAAYGATCVDDAKGVRCAFGMCPTIGSKKICIDKETIGDCHDGAVSTGKCSAFGANCVDDAKGARCVVVFCADQPTTAHDVCLPDGQRAHCTDLGGLTDVAPCPSGTSCESGSCVTPSDGSGGSPSSSGGEGGAGAGEPGGPSAGGSGNGDPWGNTPGADEIDPAALGHDGHRHPPATPVEGTCACRAAGARGPGSVGWALGLLVVALLRRRRPVVAAQH